MNWENRLWGLMVCAAFLSLGVFPASAAQVRSFTDSPGSHSHHQCGRGPSKTREPRKRLRLLPISLFPLIFRIRARNPQGISPTGCPG